MYGISPSTIVSSIPVTVTVWGVSQLLGVNVNDVGETVPSVVSSDESGIVTSSVGWVFRTTVKVWDVPSSEVSPEIVPIVKPAVSSSKLLTSTSSGSKLL